MNSLFALIAFSMALQAISFGPGAARTHKSPLMMNKVVFPNYDMSLALPMFKRPKGLDGKTWLGDKGFDPFGFSDIGIDMKYLREAELTHGRIAMLAFVGWVTSDLNPLPNHDYSPLAAHDIAVKSGAMVQIMLLVTMIEAVRIIAIKQMLEGSDRQPGDLQLYELISSTMGSSKKVDMNSAYYQDLQLKELENGRLAMLGFSGMVTVAAMNPEAHFPYC